MSRNCTRHRQAESHVTKGIGCAQRPKYMHAHIDLFSFTLNTKFVEIASEPRLLAFWWPNDLLSFNDSTIIY